MSEQATLVMRLAGPLQSWGTTSQFNRRATSDRPSKSGVIGLLAAAQGRRRGDDLTDLIELELGVRVDQPGTIMYDFHTVSTLDGTPLPSAKVNARGLQLPTGPKKMTHVSRRAYLQDAIFVAAIDGPRKLVDALRVAIQNPRFPLALGRRSCPPSQPIVLAGDDGDMWAGTVWEILHGVPWQAAQHVRSRAAVGDTVSVSVTVDDPMGDEVSNDLPTTFLPQQREFRARRVRHGWIELPTGKVAADREGKAVRHDPFALLGW